MKSDGIKGDERNINNIVVHYMISFKQLCLVTVSCPLIALFVCFVTAYIFQFNEVHEDHCRVRIIIINEIYVSNK